MGRHPIRGGRLVVFHGETLRTGKIFAPFSPPKFLVPPNTHHRIFNAMIVADSEDASAWTGGGAGLLSTGTAVRAALRGYFWGLHRLQLPQSRLRFHSPK